jgi:hypothetical protein
MAKSALDLIEHLMLVALRHVQQIDQRGICIHRAEDEARGGFDQAAARILAFPIAAACFFKRFELEHSG